MAERDAGGSAVRGVGPDATQLARGVREVLDTVCVHLDRFAEEIVAAFQVSGEGSLTEGDLDTLRDDVLATMPELDHVIGMGFAAAPDVMAGEPRCLVWWQRRGERIARLRLNLDARAVDVYDYQQMDWYRLARDERRRVAYGPYVDYSGSDQVTVTVSVPVLDGDRFLGVAATDLSMAALEGRWIDILRPSAADAVLLNSERRVVVSNSARWVVSEKLREMPVAGRGDFVDVTEVPDGTGWLVALARMAPKRT